MDIIEKYGIKEVADVVIYELDDFGEIKNPVLFLDTLKVSSIECTSEEVVHYGGTSKAPLINWEFNKDVLIKLQDALFSMKSLAVMFGGTIEEENGLILKTERFMATDKLLPAEQISRSGWDCNFYQNGKPFVKINPLFYNSNGEEVEELVSGKDYFCTYYLDCHYTSINISADTFPGYYCIIGETFLRLVDTQKDELFYFVVPKAKLISNLTLTLSTEDYSIFDLTFKAVQNKELKLIELIKSKFLDKIDKENLSILGKAILGKLILGKGE